MSPKPFEIGLVLGGAVSAGAYTAGVMDFLIEALESWERSRCQGNVPDHKVVIRVMTGASAGGMTAAITAAELLRRANNPDAVAGKGYRSLLYQAWVEDIDITRLLKPNDLNDSDEIKSLLDATAIDEIAEKILSPTTIPPWKSIPFIADELKLYLTLGNLRGLPYEFKLSGETGLPFGMTDHSDYQYVEIGKNTEAGDWIRLKNAAVATGAFPVGLAGRLIQRDTNEYRERIHKDGRPLSGLMKLPQDKNEAYDFVAVDGGMLNNEPIELARSVWERVPSGEKAKIHSVQTYEHVKQKVQEGPASDYALIMIDPFPDQVNLGRNAVPADTGLLRILGPVIGALRAQSLFKMEELLRAGDQDTDDRFLIAPIRYTETGAKARNAIASGFLAGFGGFLAREFREHDYQLGRRNCQRFLQRYFTLSEEEATKRGWTIYSEYLVEGEYPIIPIVGDENLVKPQGDNNPWPTFQRVRESSFRDGLRQRSSAILKRVLPFGWAGSSWATVVMVCAIMLLTGTELLKVAGDATDTIRNAYLLFIQLLLFSIFLILMFLRICKRLIERKVFNLSFNAVMNAMNEWGIHRDTSLNRKS